MSLIERALQRARESGKTSGSVAEQGNTGTISRSVGTAPPNGEPAAVMAISRTALAPEIMITEAFLREKGLSAPAGQERQQRAEYRHIKHGLLEEIRRPEANRLVMVTSAMEGEGKSFSSTHLALSLAAEPDYTVLLVDADVIRPNLSRTFGLLDRPGLMDVVADASLDVQSLIVSTSIDGLAILPAGRPNEHATEYFASARMREVMEQLLALPHRIVVVDSLPLLMTTEARALAPMAGQILFVVRAERTPQSAVLRGIELLGEGANVKLLLNGVVRSKALDYFGFGYGYDYSNSTNNNKEKSP